MSKPRAKQYVRFDEGTPPRFLSRCTDGVGNVIPRSAISTVTYSIFNITSGNSQPVAVARAASLTLADCWYDTLQTDDGWQSDTIGYNFGAYLPASYFQSSALKAQKYQVEIRATPTSGDAFWVGLWEADVDACLTTLS